MVKHTENHTASERNRNFEKTYFMAFLAAKRKLNNLLACWGIVFMSLGPQTGLNTSAVILDGRVHRSNHQRVPQERRSARGEHGER